ncbi:MAG: hypothetical protein KDI09_16690 [Halioglobus sp.]|nr:hypothetical protein [Halioglobus sp.]
MHKHLLIAILAALILYSSANAELTDPTRPGNLLPEVEAARAEGELRVSAVFISGDRRIAVINGQRLREGESIGGATVSAIARNKVSFVRGDRAFSVPLLSGQSRQ